MYRVHRSGWRHDCRCDVNDILLSTWHRALTWATLVPRFHYFVALITVQVRSDERLMPHTEVFLHVLLLCGKIRF